MHVLNQITVHKSFDNDELLAQQNIKHQAQVFNNAISL